MTFNIHPKDKNWVARCKMFYLVPLGSVAYCFEIIQEGYIQVGPFWSNLKDAAYVAWNWNKPLEEEK